MSNSLPDPKKRLPRNESLNCDDIIIEQMTALKITARMPRNESLNCDDIIIDGPSDKDFGPTSPAVMRYLEAEREKLRRWGALPAPTEEPTAENPGNNQGTT